jgi:hypothetical protein
MATPEADAAIEMRANVATRARSNGVRSGDEPSRRKPPAPSAGEIMDVFLGASAKLDLALKRLDTIAAQVETLRRSQSVYLGDHIACTYLQNGWRIFVDTRSFDVGIHLLMGGVWETMHSRVFERMLPGRTLVLKGCWWRSRPTRTSRGLSTTVSRSTACCAGERSTTSRRAPPPASSN